MHIYTHARAYIPFGIFIFLVKHILTRYFLIYSNALDKLFCPVLNQLVHGCMSPSAEGFRGEKHIEGLQMLLYQSAQKDINVEKFVNKLCRELESFIVELSKQFAFHEAEVHTLTTYFSET